MTVGSPVTVKLQCPDQIEDRLDKLQKQHLADRWTDSKRITELEEIIDPLQRGVKWVSRENLKLKHRIIDLEHDNADLRKKIGYLEEDLHKKKFLEVYHQPVWTKR